VSVRRLGWFLVGAAGATAALIAAPGLYGRLREAVGAGDVWTDFEPEPDNGGYAAPREDAPVYAEAEPEPEPEPEQSGVYETVVWPVPSAQPGEAEPAPAEDEADDDTAEIPAAPLTAAPPPDDTEASDLRSRIEASRQRLRHKAQGGESEGDDEPDADEPDPVA